MLDKTKLKNDLCLFISCGLSVSVISGVVFWVDNQSSPVQGDVALSEANRTIESYCSKSGIGDCNSMKLVEASAPKMTASGRGDTGWNFDYYSPQAGHVAIEVREEGDTKLVSKVQGGG